METAIPNFIIHEHHTNDESIYSGNFVPTIISRKMAIMSRQNSWIGSGIKREVVKNNIWPM